MTNDFIRLLKKNPAEFPFGLIGIPMALAVQNIAEKVNWNDPFSRWTLLPILFVTLFQFAYVMSISVFALDKAMELWRSTLGKFRLVIGMVGAILFSLLLLLEVIIPKEPWTLLLHPIEMWSFGCFATLALVLLPFISFWRNDPGTVLVLVLPIVMVSTSIAFIFLV